ncbi:MAG: hypothetical protein K6T83_00975 [Alicyclobacillus sp.]|nr:hypothetical protein [Alicyclobacillus sp.]
MSKVLKQQQMSSFPPADAASTVKIRMPDPVVVLPEPAYDAKTMDDLMDHKYRVETELAAQIAAARQEAEAMLEAVRAEAEQIRSDAYEQGYSSGYQAGLEAARADCAAECERRLHEAEQIVLKADQYRRHLLVQMRPVFIQIAMSAVRQLLYRELMLGHADFEHMVDELLTHVQDSTRVEVRVHPDDFAVASSLHPKWSNVKFGEWEVVIVPDLQVTPGGCEIRSDSSRVDARIETKLALLEETLQREWDRGETYLGDGLDPTVAQTD